MGNTWTRLVVLCVAATLSIPGCKRITEGAGGQGGSKHAPDSTQAKGDAPDPARVAAACAGAEARGPLRWFDDDYQAAHACAVAARKPLLIDAGAPWCHTCVSMETTVLMDPGMAPLAERFVWLRIDTDKPQNAATVTQFPPKTWPTFFVVAPEDESVQGRYLGAASVAQFRDFLQQSESAYLDEKRGTLPEGSPLALVRKGDRAIVAGERSAAKRAYYAALAAAPKDWPRRPQVLVSLISMHYDQEEWEPCVTLAREEMANTGRSASAADFADHALQCVENVFDSRLISEMRNTAIGRLMPLVDDDSAPLSMDDRADAMRVIREIRESMDDLEGARAMAERQRVFLDEAAAAADTPLAAMTFNWPRAEVYHYLERLGEIVPALEKSVADLPNEYDPPYRLAWVYHKMGANEKALPMAQTAVERAYGPHKARIYSLLADVYKGLGNIAGERDARKAVVAVYESLPDGQRHPLAYRRAFETLMSVEANARDMENGSAPKPDQAPRQAPKKVPDQENETAPEKVETREEAEL